MSRLAMYPVAPVTRIRGEFKPSSFLFLLSSQERGKKKEG
jgi:hypothetical protein